MYLILQSNSEAPENANVWYKRTDGCECCARDDTGRSHCQRNLINRLISQASQGTLGGSGNHCPSCNNIYVQDCLRGTSKKIGCITVEFNFRVTDNKIEAENFKRQAINHIRGPLTVETSNSQQNPEREGRPLQPNNIIRAQQPEESNKEVCINSITSPTFSKYCRDNWDEKFCCDLCKGKC